MEAGRRLQAGGPPRTDSGRGAARAGLGWAGLPCPGLPARPAGRQAAPGGGERSPCPRTPRQHQRPPTHPPAAAAQPAHLRGSLRTDVAARRWLRAQHRAAQRAADLNR